MAYEIDALDNFKNEGNAIMLKSYLEAATIKLLTDFNSFNPALKGVETIQIGTGDTVFQDGSTCGFNAVGGFELSQGTLTAKTIKVNESYCEKDLEKKWTVNRMKKGLVYDSLTFVTEITEEKTGAIANGIETLIWKGDVSVTGDTTVKQMDGFIKKVKAGSYINMAAKPAVSGATGVIAKVKIAHLAMPVSETAQEDYRILMGTDTYNYYVAELAEKNLFTPQAEKVFFGTTAKIEVLNGLNDGHVFFSRLRNFQAGGEMDNVDLDVWYSKDNDEMRLKSIFSLAATPVFIDKIGYLKLSF